LTENRTQAQFLSSYDWTENDRSFGGYSGITLSPDGTRFKLLSDRAHLLEGTITRHQDRIIGIRSSAPTPLNTDIAVDGVDVWDTEGMAHDVLGRLYISLETDNIILRRDLDGTWSKLPPFPEIVSLPRNKGLEALAVSGNGAVYAIPESSGNLHTPFPVYRYRDSGAWDIPVRLTRSDGFLPVGADFGPDGLLYVLERHFGGFGFSSRVRRIDADGASLQTGEIVVTTKIRQHDNLEGLAVWQTDTGDLRLTMVSDDNFQFFQKTEIVEYALSK